MKQQNYSEREVGPKTVWVIEFVSQVDGLAAFKHPPNINFISTSTSRLPKCKCNHQLGVSVDENSELEEVNVTEDLYDSIRKGCEQLPEHQEKSREQSSFINEQIENLGSIIEKFNDILSEFKRDKEEEK
jgi:hypothetical protein